MTTTTKRERRALKHEAGLGKGHATPKARQAPKPSPAPTGTDDVSRAVESVREAYRKARRQTRPFRAAFALHTRDRHALHEAARVAYERDTRRVRESVILGARTIPAVSHATGLRQGRVRLIVQAEKIIAVRP